ncbi:hypothetical protein ACFWXK_14620 [Streptomyces sp. NPDC059070]|uniref:hypothetical protein n=1 Tax=Streptomyces sp. NPDC059070 TaxID=3346713 RepID=UPI0036988C79
MNGRTTIGRTTGDRATGELIADGGAAGGGATTGRAVGGSAPTGVVDRPRHRGRWILVAVLSALFVVAPVCVEVYAQYARQSRSYTSFETSERHRVTAVEVDSGSAELSIGPGTEGKVRIQERLSWSLRKPRVRKEWDGDTLKLRPECDGRLAVTSLGCSVQLDLTVPEGVALTVRGGSGTVRVSGLTGPLDIRGGSGSVRLYGVRGPLSASVGSGSLSAAALGSDRARVRTGSGRAELEFVSPPRSVDAGAGSGSVAVAVPAGTRYRVEGETGSGAREIDENVIDAGSDRVITLSCSSGTATLGYVAP